MREEKDKMPVIKIFIPCHKECFVPKNPLFYPVQSGTSLSNKKFENMLHDNDGDNISSKNMMYCELDVQYWVWKNVHDADYVGFFHYRRYFSFSEKNLTEDGWGNIIYDKLNAEALQELNINENTLQTVIPQYDIIVPKRRKLPSQEGTIYEQYCSAQGQHKSDMDLMLSVLLKKHPEYKVVANEYMKSNESYDCNMYIMKKDLFNEYASFAFDILFEVEKGIDFSNYNLNETRAIGFLAEKLFGIWFVYNRDKRHLKTLELQKALFKNTDRPLEVIKTKPNSVVAVLACNNFYVPYVAALLKSIVVNAKQKRNYEIYLLTTDVTDKNKVLLKKLVEQDSRFSFSCLNISSFANTGLFTNAHISVETYYRFYILDLFKDIQKVLYLDSDMIVNADIADLYDTELNDNYFAAMIDVDAAGQIKLYDEQAGYFKNEVGIDDGEHYFQAGVLLFNIPEIRRIHTSESLIKIALNKNWRYMDQDILNHEFHKKITYINQSWNTMMNCLSQPFTRMDIIRNAPLYLYQGYLEARKNPKIIHYAGFQKPWDLPDCDFRDYFWKYARQTPFYEEILYRKIDNIGKLIPPPYVPEPLPFSTEDVNGVLRVYRRLKRTLLWRGLRKVYRIIRGK